MVRHIAAIAVLALLPAGASAQQCTSDRQAVVNEIYTRILERSADPAAATWMDALRDGRTVRDIVKAVAHSEEHMSLVGRGNAEAQVAYVYHHLLGRAPQTSLVRSRVRSQTPMPALIDSIIDSQEYTDSFGDWQVPGSQVRYCANNRSNPGGRRREPQDRFTIADRNGDGRVTVSEWDDTRQAFRLADRNNDNLLSRQEYDAAVGTGAVGTSGTLTRAQQFDALDRNGNNRLERSEWRATDDAFGWLDRNGDGWLSRVEVVGN